MRLFVPDIGTLIQLKENYTFTLYGEGRNRKLYDALGIRYPNVTVVELPKGLILKIDRVYIRKGQSSFSSITFSVPKNLNQKLINWKDLIMLGCVVLNSGLNYMNVMRWRWIYNFKRRDI